MTAGRSGPLLGPEVPRLLQPPLLPPGISGEKLEIDPVTSQKASTKFWIRQKPISIDSDHLCACDLVEERSPSEWLLGGGDGLMFVLAPSPEGRFLLRPLSGHAIFKLTYLSNHDYKPLYFESDAATVSRSC